METERNWNGDGERRRSASERTASEQTVKERVAVQAQDAKEQMLSIADAGREEVANQLEGFARAFTEAGENMRASEQVAVGRYTEIIGEQARTASRYFRERDANALIQETESFARRQPLLFLGGCFAVGLAIGRFLQASPPRPREVEGIGENIGRGPGIAPVETAPVQPVGVRVEPNPWDGGER